MTTVIEIYPKVRKPRGLKKGCYVECLGEGMDVFRVDKLDPAGYRAALLNKDGYFHGWESYSKIKVVAKPKKR